MTADSNSSRMTAGESQPLGVTPSIDSSRKYLWLYLRRLTNVLLVRLLSKHALLADTASIEVRQQNHRPIQLW